MKYSKRVTQILLFFKSKNINISVYSQYRIVKKTSLMFDATQLCYNVLLYIFFRLLCQP